MDLSSLVNQPRISSIVVVKWIVANDHLRKKADCNRCCWPRSLTETITINYTAKTKQYPMKMETEIETEMCANSNQVMYVLSLSLFFIQIQFYSFLSRNSLPIQIYSMWTLCKEENRDEKLLLNDKRKIVCCSSLSLAIFFRFSFLFFFYVFSLFFVVVVFFWCVNDKQIEMIVIWFEYNWYWSARAFIFNDLRDIYLVVAVSVVLLHWTLSFHFISIKCLFRSVETHFIYIVYCLHAFNVAEQKQLQKCIR